MTSKINFLHPTYRIPVFRPFFFETFDLSKTLILHGLLQAGFFAGHFPFKPSSIIVRVIFLFETLYQFLPFLFGHLLRVGTYHQKNILFLFSPAEYEYESHYFPSRLDFPKKYDKYLKINKIDCFQIVFKLKLTIKLNTLQT